MGRRSVQGSGLPRVPVCPRCCVCLPREANPGAGESGRSWEKHTHTHTHTTTAAENKAAAQFRATPSQKSQAEGRSKLPGQKTDRSRRQRLVGCPGWENRAEFRQVRVQESENVGADW